MVTNARHKITKSNVFINMSTVRPRATVLKLLKIIWAIVIRSPNRHYIVNENNLGLSKVGGVRRHKTSLLHLERGIFTG